MKRSLRRLSLSLLLCAFLFTSIRPAQAQIPTGTQVVLIFVAVGAIGAAIGLGVYYAVRQSPSLTGCTASTSAGLTLENESNHQAFILIGDMAAIKPGDRIRVKGKKKKDAAGKPTFLVDKLTKDFGPCKLAPATP